MAEFCLSDLAELKQVIIQQLVTTFIRKRAFWSTL